MADIYSISYKDFSQILKTLLKEKMVDKIISGESKKIRYSISPTLVSDEKDLDEFPLSQLFIFNYDRINSASKYLHKKAGGALTEKLAVVGHPCDGRALVELAKRMQVDMHNIFSIILEDIGFIQAGDLTKLLKAENIDSGDIIDEFLTPEKLSLKLKDGSIKEFNLGDKINITDNCSRCYRKKLDSNFDLAITTLGTEAFSGKLFLKIGSDKGRKAFEASGIPKTEASPSDVNQLNNIQSELMDKAKQKRESDLEAYLNNPDRINEIAKCTMCGVCINACPVCFCVSCVLQKQRKEKTIDKLSYQLTRVSHIGDSCVGCGKCDINCGPKLPLSLYFQSLNDAVKKSFGYIAGLDLQAPTPRSHKSVKEIEE